MAGRGLFVEIQHQAKVAAREADKRQQAAARGQAAAVRRSEQARKAEERAITKADRAQEADRKRLEKEAKLAHVESMLAEAEELNTALAISYAEIDELLEWTLEIDDFVDLDTFRRTPDLPPFDPGDLEKSIAPPEPIRQPYKPIRELPVSAKGLIGRKKKQAEAQSAADERYESACAERDIKMAALPAQQKLADDEHAQAEADRIAELEQARTRHQAECEKLEAEVAKHNAEIDSFIADLGYGAFDAVQEYVSIVLGNSAYPEHFEVTHEFEFDPQTAELRLRVISPPPGEMSDIKAYKYVKSTDEITSTTLSQKAQKDRYSGAVQQLALRSLHEIFEADRRGLIKAISLEVGTETAHPATGQKTYMPFVAVATERDAFIEFDLSAVVPAATLEHLGAAVSKNPFDLVIADTSGVRRA